MSSMSHPDLKAKAGANTIAPRSMAEALEFAVDVSRKPVKQIADEIGVRYGYLLEALNPHREDTQFQARLLVPLMRATGSNAPLRHLAHARGCLLLDVDPAGGNDEHTAKSLKEFGDYIHEIAAANADGRVTKTEAARIRSQVEEAVQALLNHLAVIEANAVDEEA